MEMQQTGLFFKVPAQALWRVIPQPVEPHWSAHRFITRRMRRKPERRDARPGRTKFEAALGVPGVNGHRDKYVFSLRMEWIHSSGVWRGMMVIRCYKDRQNTHMGTIHTQTCFGLNKSCKWKVDGFNGLRYYHQQWITHFSCYTWHVIYHFIISNVVKTVTKYITIYILSTQTHTCHFSILEIILGVGEKIDSPNYRDSF